MKQYLWATLLALSCLVAWEQKASAWGCGGGCGGGPSCFFPCQGIVPGPWYDFWPSGPCGQMAASCSYGHWHYSNHFQTPAPFPNDSFCNDYGGFYPSYWYGR
jgi:hypothetical protein